MIRQEHKVFVCQYTKAVSHWLYTYLRMEGTSVWFLVQAKPLAEADIAPQPLSLVR